MNARLLIHLAVIRQDSEDESGLIIIHDIFER